MELALNSPCEISSHMTAKSTTECTKCEHAHTCSANVGMDLKFDLIIPIVPKLLWDLNTIKFHKHFSFFKMVPFDIVIALYSKHRPKLLPQNPL